MPKVLIPAEYVRVKKSVDDALKSSDFLSISSDGWTDVNDTPIINFIIHSPKPYLFSSVDTTGEAHSGQYICDKISEVFDICL
jgi:lysyl-tRNA synthetase class I